MHLAGALTLTHLGQPCHPELVGLLALQAGELKMRLRGGYWFDDGGALLAALQGPHVDFVADDLTVWTCGWQPTYDQ